MLMHTVEGPQLELLSSQQALVAETLVVVQHAEAKGAAVADDLTERQMVTLANAGKGTTAG